ncbi:ArsR/SmtB family transcription factor [Fusibacter ferrireducens]|uniref:Metalloregulator ArsR/SmtB family transcription factor n=1 Tax=Fusibacter ferrireducens TaxID=2785058 RepID=A0ABR9ZW72_9FIRM|nr:metalloregulator ArsR/SmtB family transcription factor [Fusibacter ferrireducens]MBF4694231.1 metalloregulator ArsR/SmtB family transcription factor [Fusibacter ferrireducens]
MNQLTAIFKLLSDETRLRILVLLYHHDLCVCELSGILDAPQPRISKNLSKFRDQNLVMDMRQEKFVFYTLKKDNLILLHALQNIIDYLDDYPVLVNDLDRLQNLLEDKKYVHRCPTL